MRSEEQRKEKRGRESLTKGREALRQNGPNQRESTAETEAPRPLSCGDLRPEDEPLLPPLWFCVEA